MFDRCHLRALYLEIRRKWYSPEISERDAMVSRWRIAALLSASPRVASSPESQADFAIYTDAAAGTRRMASVTFAGRKQRFRLALDAATSPARPLWGSKFAAAHPIFGAEILAP